MSDLISKEKLLESLIYCKGLGRRSLEAVMETIKEQPTVELPVRGRWIRQDETYTKFMCSNCGTFNHPSTYDFCPNCGADMRGEKHD